MKVFKFHTEDQFYCISGNTEQEAKATLDEIVSGLEIERTVEIPESEWDEKTIFMYEDNDYATEPFKVSIRDLISETSELISTSDQDLID